MGRLSNEMAAEIAWLKTLGEVVSPHRSKSATAASYEVQREPSFDLADVLESGLGPGPSATYVDPPESEQQLVVQRGPKNRGFLLTNTYGEPMLLARACKDGRGYEIFPGHVGGADDLRPMFLLQSNKEKTEWSLHSIKCERCQANNRAECGQRLLARMSHFSEATGESAAKCMDVEVPNICHDGSLEVLCDVCGDDRSSENMRLLSTRRPVWSTKRNCMVLSFKGRAKVPSAKNFQLETVDEEHREVKLLFGKMADQRFVLDHQGPFGTAQAFAMALSASHWN